MPDLFVQTFFNYFLLKLLYPIIFFKIRILVTNFNLNSQLKLHFYLPIITYYLKFVKYISPFFLFQKKKKNVFLLNSELIYTKGMFGREVWEKIFVVFCNFLKYVRVKKCVKICLKCKNVNLNYNTKQALK